MTTPPAEQNKTVSIKAIVAGVITVLALILVFQNTTQHSYSVFAWTITAPAWVWLLTLLVAGVIIGSLFPWFRLFGRNKKS